MSSWKGAADGRSARREPLVPRRCLVIRTARRGHPKSSQWRPTARGRTETNAVPILTSGIAAERTVGHFGGMTYKGSIALLNGRLSPARWRSRARHDRWSTPYSQPNALTVAGGR